MMGIIYLLLCFALGWAISLVAFPKLSSLTKTDYLKRKILVSPYLILLPVWYVTGTLVLTWATYLIGYLCRAAKEPLLYANMISMPTAAIVIFLAAVYQLRRKEKEAFAFFCKDYRARVIEAFFIIGLLVLACLLMWTTFYVSGRELNVGVTVFSDFSPHVGMIRSFSYGNNFPTAYPHYAGEDIRYHFMFQFLAGNLEFLGLRIDYAFNLPSSISFVSAFLLLYVLAVKISGRVGAGLLACLFFAFRSSKTLFTYLSELPQGTNIFKALNDNMSFISSTPNEDWGLWNLNVYCNQRHLAFGLTVIFFVLLLFLPQLYAMFESIKQYHFEHKSKNNHQNTVKRVLGIISVLFFTKEGWVLKDIKTSVAVGILLGSLSFFHGAAVIGILTVLFLIAIVSERRLEYLVMAVITIMLSTLQTKFFIHGSAVAPELLFGFIAENKTLFGVASYLERLLGILPLVLLVAFCLEKGANRYLVMAFSAPLLFALTISLTIDVTVNHKYIMISCILLGIFAAGLVIKLFDLKEFRFGALGLLLTLLLTATGIYDFTTVLKKNTEQSPIVLDLDSQLTKWINDHSTSKDLFLTSNYTLNQVVLGGAMLYEGWPYYPWSAGYDTNFRTAEVKKMYEAATPAELKNFIEENQIRFIIVDKDNRDSEDYELNEENIMDTYECVYTEGEGEWRTSIYDTKRSLQ